MCVTLNSDKDFEEAIYLANGTSVALLRDLWWIIWYTALYVVVSDNTTYIAVALSTCR
jgi:hypothetical protein